MGLSQLYIFKAQTIELLEMVTIRHTTPSYDAIIEALKKDMLKSNCPEGGLRIENLYYDPVTKELVWDIEEK